MHRLAASGVFALALLAACSKEPTAPAVSSAPVTANDHEESFDGRGFFDRSTRPLDLAVIGDVPYGDQALGLFPTLIGAINADPKVRVAVHVGDIKSGSTECSDSWFEEIARQFDTFKDPLIYAVGDNEWTDCHRANNGGYDPLDRLAKIREIFFSDPDEALGGRKMRVAYDRDLPEDVLWQKSRVTFASFHVIGSNNGLDSWGGIDRPAAREAEVAARNAANIEWLERTFTTARRRGSVGVALFWQADLWHPKDRAEGARFDAHDEFVAKLAELAAAYGKPVLIVCGDSHDYRVDVGVPWFTLYGQTPLPNVTQVVVDRSIEVGDATPVDWLRLHIDPRSPDVFSWKQVLVN